jgi:cytochrome c
MAERQNGACMPIRQGKADGSEADIPRPIRHGRAIDPDDLSGEHREWRKSVFVSFLLVLLLCFLSNVSGYAQKTIPVDIKVLLEKHVCVTCHKLDEKLIGPSYIELARKGQSAKEISALIYEPKPSNWPGYPPMAPMPQLPKEDVKKIAAWIVGLRE